MRSLSTPTPKSSFPLDFIALSGTPQDCEDCAKGRRLPFQFDFAYQPIVDLANGTVFAHEALVRGPQGEGAMTVLSQLDAENCYRFDQACRVKAIKGAAELGMQQAVSINFLPNAIYQPELCIRTTLAAARAHGFALDRIIFEVTEGERVQDGPWFAQILREYQRCGFKTAIDDFGAGFAGMKLLADFQPDIIKLDMELIRGLDASLPRRIIVDGVMKMCAALGVEVIAEGIETRGELDALREIGVRYIQGYLFARPGFQSLPMVDAVEVRAARAA